MLILPCFKNAWDRIQNHQSKYYVLRKTSDTNEREWGPKMEFTSALWPTCLGSKRKRPGLTIRIMNCNNNDKINCSIWSAHAFPVYHFWKFGGEGGRLCPMQRLVKMKNVSWKLWLKRYTYFKTFSKNLVWAWINTRKVIKKLENSLSGIQEQIEN